MDAKSEIPPSEILKGNIKLIVSSILKKEFDNRAPTDEDIARYLLTTPRDHVVQLYTTMVHRTAPNILNTYNDAMDKLMEDCASKFPITLETPVESPIYFTHQDTSVFYGAYQGGRDHYQDRIGLNMSKEQLFLPDGMGGMNQANVENTGGVAANCALKAFSKEQQNDYGGGAVNSALRIAVDSANYMRQQGITLGGVAYLMADFGGESFHFPQQGDVGARLYSNGSELVRSKDEKNADGELTNYVIGGQVGEVHETIEAGKYNWKNTDTVIVGCDGFWEAFDAFGGSEIVSSSLSNEQLRIQLHEKITEYIRNHSDCDNITFCVFKKEKTGIPIPRNSDRE